MHSMPLPTTKECSKEFSDSSILMEVKFCSLCVIEFKYLEPLIAKLTL